MNNNELTLCAIKERVEKLEGPKYRKLEGSSYAGVLYEIYDEQCGRKVTVDIRLEENHNALIFAMYPGVIVASKEYIPSMAMYCQGIKVSLGSVDVERIHRDVKFHAATCYKDNPVTEKTLETLEKTGMEILGKHYENLKKLATGRIMDIDKIKEEEAIGVEYPDYELDANVRSIRDYLMNKSHYNAICESFSENGETKFCCHILTEKDSFKLDILFKKNGFLTFRANCGENAMLIEKPYRYGVADYLNEKNAKNMFSAINIGDDSQGVYGEISTSLLDGVIGEETIEFLEGALLKYLRDSAYAVQMLSVGIVPREEEEDEETWRMLEEMTEMLKKELDERCGNGNGIGTMPDNPALSNAPFKIPSFLRRRPEDDSLFENMDILLPTIDHLNDEEDMDSEDVEDEVSMDDYLKRLEGDDAEEEEE